MGHPSPHLREPSDEAGSTGKKNLSLERVEESKTSKTLCCKVPDLGLLGSFSAETVMDFMVLDSFLLKGGVVVVFIFLHSAAVGTEHGWSLPQVAGRVC